MSEENANVMIGEVEVSLADLAGVDMSDVQEVRSSVIPAGKFHFRIKDSEMKAVESTNKEDPQGAKINKPVIRFELEAQNCFSLVDDTLDPEDHINDKHYETFWINDLKKDLGRVKAFLVDIGIDGNKPLNDLLAEAHGMEFVGDITHSKKKDNPDEFWVNLKNITTVEEFQGMEVSGTEEAAPTPAPKLGGLAGL